MAAASAQEVTLHGTPESVPVARAFVRRVLGEAATAPDRVERAALAVSELVTNAVVHTATPIRVRVRPGEPGVPGEVARVEVEDRGGALPIAAPPGLPLAASAARRLTPGGLGLALVGAVASRWGVVETAGPGKIVWFEVDQSPGRGGGVA